MSVYRPRPHVQFIPYAVATFAAVTVVSSAVAAATIRTPSIAPQYRAAKMAGSAGVYSFAEATPVASGGGTSDATEAAVANPFRDQAPFYRRAATEWLRPDHGLKTNLPALAGAEAGVSGEDVINAAQRPFTAAQQYRVPRMLGSAALVAFGEAEVYTPPSPPTDDIIASLHRGRAPIRGPAPRHPEFDRVVGVGYDGTSAWSPAAVVASARNTRPPIRDVQPRHPEHDRVVLIPFPGSAAPTTVPAAAAHIRAIRRGSLNAQYYRTPHPQVQYSRGAPIAVQRPDGALYAITTVRDDAATYYRGPSHFRTVVSAPPIALYPEPALDDAEPAIVTWRRDDTATYYRLARIQYPQTELPSALSEEPVPPEWTIAVVWSDTTAVYYRQPLRLYQQSSISTESYRNPAVDLVPGQEVTANRRATDTIANSRRTDAKA